MIDELRSVIETVDPSIVQFADMRSFESTELKITVRKGKAEDVSSDKLGGVAIRVLVDGAWGFASVASFERQRLLETLSTAIKMAKVLRNISQKRRKSLSTKHLKVGMSSNQMSTPKSSHLKRSMNLQQKPRKSSESMTAESSAHRDDTLRKSSGKPWLIL